MLLVDRQRPEDMLVADRRFCQALHLKDTTVVTKNNRLIGRSGRLIERPLPLNRRSTAIERHAR
jgi:hypothetical protein